MAAEQSPEGRSLLGGHASWLWGDWVPGEEALRQTEYGAWLASRNLWRHFEVVAELARIYQVEGWEKAEEWLCRQK